MTQKQASQLAEARYAIREAQHCEDKAAQATRQADKAFKEVGEMKAENQARAATRRPRMLPTTSRAIDVQTASFKEVQDAKGDHLYYSSQAAMYAALATMLYTKASVLMQRHQMGLEPMKSL